MKRKWDYALMKELKEKRESGLTFKEVGKIFGVSGGRAYQLYLLWSLQRIKEHDVPPQDIAKKLI